jgi:poly(3-hydroxybutyrate) depolymerase
MDIWREVQRFLLIVAILSTGLPTGAAPPLPLLPALGAEHQVTVSGLSSGGYMAAQFAVAFSKDVKGVGVIAGGPYGCSQGNVLLAATTCSCAIPGACSSPTPSVLAFQSWNAAEGKAALNLVDPLVGLKAQRVWMLSGGKDVTVRFANVKALQLFYVDRDKGHAPPQQVQLQRLARAGHGMPILNTPKGVACSLTAAPFINNCADDAAGDLLAWLYPGPALSTASIETGQLLDFDQTVYTQGLDYTGLADKGYVFVPDACNVAGAACRLHVVFHGCQQSGETLVQGCRWGDCLPTTRATTAGRLAARSSCCIRRSNPTQRRPPLRTGTTPKVAGISGVTRACSPPLASMPPMRHPRCWLWSG